MEIVFVTRHGNAPAASFYRQALSGAFTVFSCYAPPPPRGGVFLFMSHPDDLEQLIRYKSQHPQQLCGVLDPYHAGVVTYLGCIDFLVVDSIEMYDYWINRGPPVIRYAEYPMVPVFAPRIVERSRLIIGYHGNIVHLAAMRSSISPALAALAQDRRVEFWASYAFRARGRWRHGLPRGVTVRHINWHPGVFETDLRHVDIGIVPATIPCGAALPPDQGVGGDARELNLRADDYCLRFKMSSNPGRIIVWGRLGVPVVADLYPSALDLICHGTSGLLAASENAWCHALRFMDANPERRLAYARCLQQAVIERFAFEHQNACFRQFITQHFRIPVRCGSHEALPACRCR